MQRDIIPCTRRIIGEQHFCFNQSEVFLFSLNDRLRGKKRIALEIATVRFLVVETISFFFFFFEFP